MMGNHEQSQFLTRGQYRFSASPGFSLVEALLSGALLSIIALGMIAALLYGEESGVIAGKRQQAAALANESIEALRNMRDNDFANLTAGTWGLAQVSGQWALQGSSDTTNNFTREVQIGLQDATIASATTTITWNQTLQRTGVIQLFAQLVNFVLNSIIDTAQADFNSGGINSTQVTNTSGGEVQLRSEGTWTSTTQHHLLDLTGGQNANALFLDDNVVWVARVNNAGGDELFQIDVSDISNASTSVIDSFNIGETITGLYVATSSQMAYMSSGDNSNDLIILNIATDGVTNVNVPGNADATDVTFANDKILISKEEDGSNAEFFVYDSSGVLLGEVEVDSDVYAVTADDTYAYIATADNNELWVIDFNDCPGEVCAVEREYNPANGGGSDGTAIVHDGDVVYLGRDNNYIHALALAKPVTGGSIITELVSYDAGNDSVTDITVDKDIDTIFVTTDDGGSEEVLAIDYSTPSSPSHTEIDIEGGTDANAIVKAGAYIYIASSDGDELQVYGTGSSASYALKDTYDAGGGDNANDVFVVGDYAYLATDDDFYVLNVSDPTDVSLEDSIAFGFDINDVYVSGDYAYLATDDNSQELTIVDISDPTDISEVGDFDTNGGSNGLAIWVVGTTAYIATSNNNGGFSSCNNSELYVLDVSTPASVTCSGSYNVGSQVNDVQVSGNYAYLATNAGSDDLLILTISSPALITEAASYDATSNFNGVHLVGTTLYAVADDSGGDPDFYVFDVSTPTSPSLTTSYDTGDQNNDVRLSGDYAYLATNEDDEGMTILDISDAGSGSITQEYAYDTVGDCNGIHYDGTNIFVACENNSTELIIVGSNTSTSQFPYEGWFTSQSHNSGSASTVWSSVAWTESSTEAATTDWFDSNYQYRSQLSITTGANAPSGTYNGYTVRITGLNTSALVSGGKMQSDCDDLRIARDTGASWSEIDRRVISCNNAATDVHFKLAADISDSSTDTDYYIYYGYGSASTATALGTTNVYDWYDDVGSDRSGSYTLGRCDAWHGTGYNAWSYSGGGYYENDTGDNFTGCMRHSAGERDAYIEAEMYHLGCYPSNMTTGLLGRYILGSGSGSSESASHYYASNRGHQSSCGSGYSQDGDIIEGSRTGTAIDGTNPAALSINQWRKQALAVWGINDTNATYWDSDTVAGFGTAGFPSVGTNADGTDGSDQESSGDWGVIAAQDDVRVRNILIRRYTEPEPTVVVGSEEEYSSGTGDGDIQLRLRTAPNSGGVPGTWTQWLGPTSMADFYVDPDGDETINSSHSDGSNDQWLQYRAYFFSTGTTTPILQDVTIEY